MDITIPVCMTVRVNLDGHVRVPEHHCLFLLSRYDLAKEGITVQAGFQDSLEQGTMYVMFHNSTRQERKVSRGDRICQGLTIPLPRIQLKNGVFSPIGYLWSEEDDWAS